MSEWWTYRPSDFLMFAPATYRRLFELHNAALWPAQALLLPAGLAWIAWLGRGAPAALRAGAAALAVLLAGCAGLFVMQRYAPINWAAPALAGGLCLLAAGLAAVALRRGLQPAAGLRRRIGLLLVVWALLAHPLLAPAAGRPWSQAEVFGLAPDPTVIAALGLLACARAGSAGRWAALPWTLALAWCAVSAATLWTMGSAQGWVPAVAALAALGATRLEYA